MARAILAFKNYDTICSFSGGRWYAALPLANLKEQSISKVARSKGVTENDTIIEGELSTSQILDFLGLDAHTDAQDAYIRARFSNDPGAITNVLYDTGTIKMWSRVYSTSQLKSEAINWLTGHATPAELEGYKPSFAHPFAMKGWAQVAINASDISASAADNSYNSVSTDLSGFTVGSTILISGFSTAGNNGWRTVVSRTATKIIVSGGTVTNEIAAAGHKLVTYDVDYVKAKYFRIDISDTSNINIDITGTDISAASGDNSFNSVSTDLSTLGVGQTITVTGFDTGANNGDFTVVSKTSTKVVVSGGTLVTEAAGDDVEITTGNIDIARLWVGEKIEFDYDIQVGFSERIVDLSQAQRMESGAKHHIIKAKLRQVEFTYRGLSEEKAYSNIYEMLRQKGIHGEVYFLFDKNNDRFTFKKSFLGTIVQLNEVKQEFVGTQTYYTWSATVEEKL